MIEKIRQRLQANDIPSRSQWFAVPLHTVHYWPVKAAPTRQDRFVAQIKAMLGYRTVAHILGLNKNTVQHIFRIKGWQLRKRPVGFRPRIQSLPSMAKAPNER